MKAFYEQLLFALIIATDADVLSYLEDAYSNRPSLFRRDAGGRAVTRFIKAWADGVLVGGILRLVITDIFAHLDEKDRAYFRQTREQRFGAALETISVDRETNVLAFRKTLEPIRTVLAAQPFLGGDAPAYADYAARLQRGKVGRAWVHVATPKRRGAVAERQAQLARIDNPDGIIRVR